MGGTNRKKGWALGMRHSIQQRLRPKSLDSQTPTRFSSLGLKKKTYMWLEVENQEGEKTSAKKPRPLDLNQRSLMLIHIHTISHMINFRILRSSPVPHHSVSQENKLEVVREDPYMRSVYELSWLEGCVCGPVWVLGNKPGDELPRSPLIETTKIFVRWPAQHTVCPDTVLHNNCETFSTKTTSQHTDDSVWRARSILRSPVSTIPLGVLVQAAVKWKMISTLLTSLRHSKAGTATQPCAWKEPGCFWNGSGFVLVSGTAQRFAGRPQWFSHSLAFAAPADFPLLTVASVTGRHFNFSAAMIGTIHCVSPHTHIYRRAKWMIIAQFRQEGNKRYKD